MGGGYDGVFMDECLLAVHVVSLFANDGGQAETAIR